MCCLGQQVKVTTSPPHGYEQFQFGVIGRTSVSFRVRSCGTASIALMQVTVLFNAIELGNLHVVLTAIIST